MTVHGQGDLDPFVGRVAALRDLWESKRLLKPYRGRHDRDAELQRLMTVFGWAGHSVERILAAYGDSLTLELTAPPQPKDSVPGFAALLGENHRLSFVVGPDSAQPDRWLLTAELRTPSVHSNPRPDRRAGEWTRLRVEELLLALLADYERARFDAA